MSTYKLASLPLPLYCGILLLAKQHEAKLFSMLYCSSMSKSWKIILLVIEQLRLIVCPQLMVLYCSSMSCSCIILLVILEQLRRHHRYLSHSCGIMICIYHDLYLSHRTSCGIIAGLGCNAALLCDHDLYISWLVSVTQNDLRHHCPLMFIVESCRSQWDSSLHRDQDLFVAASCQLVAASCRILIAALQAVHYGMIADLNTAWLSNYIAALQAVFIAATLQHTTLKSEIMLTI
jgi:hypothetical protein